MVRFPKRAAIRKLPPNCHGLEGAQNDPSAGDHPGSGPPLDLRSIRTAPAAQVPGQHGTKGRQRVGWIARSPLCISTTQFDERARPPLPDRPCVWVSSRRLIRSEEGIQGARRRWNECSCARVRLRPRDRHAPRAQTRRAPVGNVLRAQKRRAPKSGAHSLCVQERSRI